MVHHDADDQRDDAIHDVGGIPGLAAVDAAVPGGPAMDELVPEHMNYSRQPDGMVGVSRSYGHAGLPAGHFGLTVHHASAGSRPQSCSSIQHQNTLAAFSSRDQEAPQKWQVELTRFRGHLMI